MFTFDTAVWFAIAVFWLGIALFVYRMIGRIWNDRLARCPESGAIALLTIGRGAGPDGRSGPVVRECTQWPQRQGCAQGCLARHPEDGPVFRVDMEALRPFDTPKA